MRWQSLGWQDIYNTPHGGHKELSQDAYWRVNLTTRYRITENLLAALNANTIFDKYCDTHIGFYNSAAYGAPCNFMVSTR